ncbi:MAG: PD40 domain-containing protein, partial [Verrucomicrobia bacterium]|nr:PD40 domain-containing protein [Verrucomicrobiota bacterium]
MTNFINQFEPFIRDCLWQSTLCLLVGLGGSLCWAKRPARSHRVLLLALGAALVAPLLSLAVRHYDWGMLPPSASVARANSEKPTQSAPTVSLTRSATVQSPDVPEKAIGSVALAEASAGEKLPVPWAVADNALPQFRWKAIALSVWAALSGLAGLRLALSILRGLALIKRAEPDADLCIQNAANLAASKLGIAAAPEVRVSKEVGCPVIWCWHKRPLLVIPAAALPSRGTLDWEGLFCHELAHWKRRDHLAELFAEIAAMILPWQPLVWWSRTRLSHLADAVCDEWALHCGRQGPAYANSLLELLPQIRSVGAIPAVRNRRKLERRIRRILNPESPQPNEGIAWRRCAGFAAVVGTGLLGLFQVQKTGLGASVADQAPSKEGVSIAKERAADEPKPQASATARRLVIGNDQGFWDDQDNLALAPDGRHLARVSYNNNELILVDTQTGVHKKVADRCEWGVVWSSDGKRIAFGSRPDGVPFSASTATNRLVSVVEVATGKAKILWSGNFILTDWSSQSERLLGYRAKDFSGPNVVVLMDLDTGKQTEFEGNPVQRSAYPKRLSPDGKLIAYCTEEPNRSELFLHEIDSSNRVVLPDFHGKKSDPIWSPDGKHLLFRCSQPGAGQQYQDLWCVRVQEGKFVGSPLPVMGNVSDMKFYNWARNGQLAYSVSFRPRNGLYLLEIDPENARAKG